MINKYTYIHLLGIISKIMRKVRTPKKLCCMYNDNFHKIVEKKLNPYFNKIYSYVKKYDHHYIEGTSNIIWIFWWQGLTYAPFIVKKCVNSIVKNSNNYHVIIVSKYNINKYTTIPQYIYSLLYNNKISFTHFSDVLRFNLLRNHGGLWIDSTMFCTSKINYNSKDIYTSGGYINSYHFFVSAKWTEFLIGGCRNNPIFIFMDEFFKYYWRKNNTIIDYFMADYALNYIYINNIGNFAKYVNHKALKNNPHLHDLQSLLNKKFNNNLYKKITADTNLFKLTYKKKFKNNGTTFYSKVINS